MREGAGGRKQAGSQLRLPLPPRPCPRYRRRTSDTRRGCAAPRPPFTPLQPARALRRRGNPGALPARLPGSPCLSPLQDRGAPRRQPPHSARTDTAAPTRPPHWLPVTCLGGLRQSAPPERGCWKIWKVSLLSKGAWGRRLGPVAGPGRAEPRPAPAPAPDSATAPKAGGDDPSSATCSVHARAQPCYA